MRLRSIRGVFTVAGCLLLLLLVFLFLAPRSAAAPGPPSFAGAGPPAAGFAALSTAAEPVTGTVQLHLPAVYKAPRPQLPPQTALDLGTLGGSYSAACAVNRSGQVAGMSSVREDDSGSIEHAFRWQNGRMQDLGTLGGKNSTALAINDSGQIAGDSDIKTGAEPHAFFWAKGHMTDIGTLGGAWSRTVALNARGQVAGNSSTASGAGHCFVWAAGVIADLGTLGGDSCTATGINERGQVVGYSTLPGSEYVTHAFLWQDGVMLDLTPTLAPEASSSAAAINGPGQIAGSLGGLGTQCNAWGCAVFWVDGATIDLSAGGEGLNMVEALNERGQVAGYGNYEFYSPPYGYSWDAQLWDNGQLIDLGFKRGRWPIYNLLLDNGGQVVVSDGSSVTLWQGGVLTPLLALGGGSAYATALDEAGHVVGHAEHALLWNIAPAAVAKTAD